MEKTVIFLTSHPSDLHKIEDGGGWRREEGGRSVMEILQRSDRGQEREEGGVKLIFLLSSMNKCITEENFE